MTFRTAIGLKPTPTDLALDLIKAAEATGLTGWNYDLENDAIRNADRVINLANMHLEYAAAPRAGRRILLQKYVGMLKTPPVPKLWSLAQTKLYPVLRSRYDRVTIDIDNRRKEKPTPARAGRRLIGNLDQILGYDHDVSISQVTIENLDEWGVTLEAAIDRAMMNLRSLSGLRWHDLGNGVWQLDSPSGYAESLMQIPRVFSDLPARGTPLVMIPNRGVLLATGSEEQGVATLLKQARKFLQEAPWPLSGEIFKVGSDGIQLFLPSGPDATALAGIERMDIASVYAAQKASLEAYTAAIEDDVFIATFGLLTPKDNPDELQSWCSWTQGVPTLLPQTDLIAFVWDLDTDRKTALVAWAAAAAIVGHYFKPTAEDPPRTRVDEFPNPVELAELQKHSV